MSLARVVMKACQKHCSIRKKEWYRKHATRSWKTTHGPLHLIERGGNVLGIAHMDTVMWSTTHRRVGSLLVNCPQLDDRAGVAIILDVLPQIGIKCDVALTDSEEVCRSTAQFLPDELSHDYNWIFSFDRFGEDCVLYEFKQDTEWHEECKKQFTLGIGSFSDIRFATHLGLCGLNIGCGYHLAHSMDCYLDANQAARNIQRFKLFYDENEECRWDFLPKEQMEQAGVTNVEDLWGDDWKFCT